MQSEALTIAIEALSWMELRRINERLALRRTAGQLDIRDEGTLRHAYRLIMEATRRRNALDHLAVQALGEEGFEALNLGVRSFLRIYISEVNYGDVPYREAVEIAEQARDILGARGLAPVEEALDILPHLELRLEGFPEDEAIALMTFHPAWYVRYCRRLLGGDDCLRLLQAPDPPTYVRLNTLRGSDEEIRERLRLEGVGLEEEPGLEHLLRVKEEPRPMNLTDAHSEGLFTVQDKASTLAGVVAAPEPRMTVLDVCAAPGGKTGHLAQLMENRGRILSMDFSERRLDAWRREMARLGVENAAPVLGDARRPRAFPDVEADVVLVDPPCTGTGTFNRTPSGKWRLTSGSIDRMKKIQRRILYNCADHVAEGGCIVYCTCSVTAEENEMVVRDFLQVHGDFEMVEARPRLGLPGLMGQDAAQRLYPHIHGCNGFYLAKLARS